MRSRLSIAWRENLRVLRLDVVTTTIAAVRTSRRPCFVGSWRSGTFLQGRRLCLFDIWANFSLWSTGQKAAAYSRRNVDDVELMEKLGHSVERIYLRQRSSDVSVNKTILKLRLALAAGPKYVYVGFSRYKIPRSSAARWQPRQGCKVP